MKLLRGIAFALPACLLFWAVIFGAAWAGQHPDSTAHHVAVALLGAMGAGIAALLITVRVVARRPRHTPLAPRLDPYVGDDAHRLGVQR